MYDWLMTPLSGALAHDIAPALAWHARAMLLAWGLLLPLGVLMARYYRITPTQDWPRQLDNKLWWHAHRWLQYAGIAAMSLGLVLVLPWGPPASIHVAAIWHATLGWGLCALGWLQIVGAWLRGSKGGPSDAQCRGDHCDMTPRRRNFERLHKSLGCLALLLAVAVIGLGLVTAYALRWMPAALTGWVAVLVIWAVRLQRQGRCADTYQAIWGADLTHPGNRRAPIGWGIRRRP